MSPHSNSPTNTVSIARTARYIPLLHFYKKKNQKILFTCKDFRFGRFCAASQLTGRCIADRKSTNSAAVHSIFIFPKNFRLLEMVHFTFLFWHFGATGILLRYAHGSRKMFIN